MSNHFLAGSVSALHTQIAQAYITVKALNMTLKAVELEHEDLCDIEGILYSVKVQCEKLISKATDPTPCIHCLDVNAMPRRFFCSEECESSAIQELEKQECELPKVDV